MHNQWYDISCATLYIFLSKLLIVEELFFISRVTQMVKLFYHAFKDSQNYYYAH